MLKKKVLAIAASAALILPAFSINSMAAYGDVITVGDKNVKIVQDFNDLEDGFRIGLKKDPLFSCSNNKDEIGCIYQVKDKMGVDGTKGLWEAATSSLASDGKYSSFTYKMQKDQMDLSGGTDFVFWVDNTFQTNKDSSFQILFKEWDYDKDGKPIIVTDPDTDTKMNQATSWFLKDSKTTTWYMFEDGKWVEQKGTGGCYVSIKQGYKGYIRIPLENNFETHYDSNDDNGKIDLKHVVNVELYYGIYPRDIKGAFTVDNIGFAGNYEKPTTATTTTTTKADPTTTKKPADGTTTAVKNDPTNVVTTAAPVVNETTTATGSSESPKTGEMPITAALVTAVTFAGVLVASKKRNK